MQNRTLRPYLAGQPRRTPVKAVCRCSSVSGWLTTCACACVQFGSSQWAYCELEEALSVGPEGDVRLDKLKALGFSLEGAANPLVELVGKEANAQVCCDLCAHR
jgi:hypothetical protein